jgi:preprotein translocase subunit SecD
MITGPNRFNIYLFLALAIAVASCSTPNEEKQEDKPVARLGVHLETLPDPSASTMPVPIFRQSPVIINVEKRPILTEANMAEAKVVEYGGSFALQLQFDRRGAWLLESYSSSNPGRHFAIYCQFGPKLKESRWLAAPIIPRRISNGILVFTPDATREETDTIVLGLNAVARQVEQKDRW